MKEKIAQDDIDALLSGAFGQAQDAIDEASTLADGFDESAPDGEMADLGSVVGSRGDIEILGDVELDVSIELGRTEMLVDEVLQLGSGAVVELNKLAGDPVDVRVNGRLVARGEVLVLNDNFCIRVSEIVAGTDAIVRPAAVEAMAAPAAMAAAAGAGGDE